jgi:AAA domain, putative AbiEii toxin, Type IV TA system/AAA ATPase domain
VLGARRGRSRGNPVRKARRLRYSRAVLSRVRIERYRALGLVDVALKPITVLIGKNDSGKTSFLHALAAFASWRGISGDDFWRRQPQNIDMRGWLDTGASTTFSFHPQRSNQALQGTDYPTVYPDISPVGYFRLSIDGIPTDEQGSPDSPHAPTLNENGSGLATLLDYLLRRDRPRFDQIQKAARDHIPGVEEILIATPQPMTRRIDLKIDNGLILPAASASTGVRLILFFIALVFHPTPPKIVLLEEPETGVHPARLKEIIELLRAISKGEHGANPAQVVLTTHSPHLLDHIDLNTDQVLVFRRQTDGQRTAQAVDAEGLKVFLDEFALGEIWFNQGEEGLLPKNPDAPAK